MFPLSYASDSFSIAAGAASGYWAFQSGPGSSANGVPDTNGCTPPDPNPEEDNEDEEMEEGVEEVGVVVSSATVDGVILDATGNVTVDPSARTI